MRASFGTMTNSARGTFASISPLSRDSKGSKSPQQIFARRLQTAMYSTGHLEKRHVQEHYSSLVS